MDVFGFDADFGVAGHGLSGCMVPAVGGGGGVGGVEGADPARVFVVSP